MESARWARRSTTSRRSGRGQGSEDVGYDGVWSRPRPATTRSSRCSIAARAHRAHRARHRHRGRVRPHPDDAREHRQGTSRRYSKGRFILGLGSQIKPHIEKRFSMPWSHPAAAHARVHPRDARDLGERGTTARSSTSEGEFYRHTLMTPFFNPGPNPYGAAEGVPRRGRREDDRGRGRGRRRHHPARLHHRALRPRGHAARARARAGQGRARRAPTSSSPVRCSSSPAPTEEELAKARARARSSRSRSTARRPRTAACSSCTAGATSRPSSTGCRSRASGWRWASSSTTRCSTRSRSSASPRRSPTLLHARYGDVVDRLSFYAPYQADPERWSQVLAGFKNI